MNASPDYRRNAETSKLVEDQTRNRNNRPLMRVVLPVMLKPRTFSILRRNDRSWEEDGEVHQTIEPTMPPCWEQVLSVYVTYD